MDGFEEEAEVLRHEFHVVQGTSPDNCVHWEEGGYLRRSRNTSSVETGKKRKGKVWTTVNQAVGLSWRRRASRFRLLACMSDRLATDLLCMDVISSGSRDVWRYTFGSRIYSHLLV